MKLTPPAPPRPCRVLNSPSLLPPHTHNPTHHPHPRSSLISPSPISFILPSLTSHHLSIIFSSSSSPRRRSGPSRGKLKRFRNSSRFPTTKADSRCRHTFKHTTGRRPSICIRGRELLDVGLEDVGHRLEHLHGRLCRVRRTGGERGRRATGSCPRSCPTRLLERFADGREVKP